MSRRPPPAREPAPPARAPRRRKRLLLAAAVALLGGVAGWLFLPQLTAAHVAQRTRFDVSIEHLRFNPFAGRMEVHGLVIENPAVFGPREFLHVKTLHVDVRPLSWLSKQRVVEDLVVDLPKVVIVTNTDGTTNLDLFRERWQGSSSAPRRGQAVMIQRLRLRVGEVRLINLSTRQPRERRMPLDFEETYQGVTHWTDLLVPALLQRLAVAGGDLQDLEPEDLGPTLSGLLRRGGGLAPERERRATDTLKSLFEKLEEKPKP